jgi:hypothetical protein
MQMLEITSVGVWPVGAMYTGYVSTPIVSMKEGTVLGFFDGFSKTRTFPVDFAGFAINLQLLHDVSNLNCSINLDLHHLPFKANSFFT